MKTWYLPAFAGLLALFLVLAKNTFVLQCNEDYIKVFEELSKYWMKESVHGIAQYRYPVSDTGITSNKYAFRRIFQKDRTEISNQNVYWRKNDPEMYMNATELITSKGIPCEEHYPHTADGYILGMQRMPQPSKNRLPVLLMHGLLASSDSFLTNLVNESLAYILYHAGYDVWLGNVRGNAYSLNHETIPSNDLRFWKWSFDEMGEYDIPAMVEYIINVTGHDRINYIGHSQGTTSLFAASMTQGPRLNDKIKLFIALAPAGLVPDMTSPLHYLSYVAKYISLIYNLFGEGDFLPHSGLLTKVANLLCPKTQRLCENILFLFGGSDISNMNASRVPVYTAHNPSGTSTQNMIHWAQMIKNKKNSLLFYDYGHWYLNLWHYHSIYPPSYDFNAFNISTYAFCGSKDTLVVPDDCKRFLSSLSVIQKVYFVPEYTHLDFIWAVSAPRAVYDTVLNILSL